MAFYGENNQIGSNKTKKCLICDKKYKKHGYFTRVFKKVDFLESAPILSEKRHLFILSGERSLFSSEWSLCF